MRPHHFAIEPGLSGGGVRRNAEEADGRDGEMAERLNAAVLKTAEPSRVPWVRIPLSPPASTPESTAFTQAQVERQVGTSVLAKADALTEVMLELFR